MSKTNPEICDLADLDGAARTDGDGRRGHGVIWWPGVRWRGLDDKSWLPHFNDLINDGFGLPAPVRQVMTRLYHEVIEA